MVCTVLAHMAAAAAAGGLYVHLATDGDSCESAGLLYIETKEECEDAAASLQLAGTDAFTDDSEPGADDAYEYPYGCYYHTPVLDLSNFPTNWPPPPKLYWNVADTAKGDVQDNRIAICKLVASPEPVGGHPVPGWVAFSNFLMPADIVEPPDTLRLYEMLEILPILFFIFFLSVSILITTFGGTKRTVRTTVCELGVISLLENIYRCLMGQSLRRFRDAPFVECPQRNATQGGWAERKTEALSKLHRYGFSLIIPIMLITLSVLDTKGFDVAGDNSLVLAPCAIAATESDASSSGYNNVSAPSLKIRHGGVCQAVANGYDCFESNYDFGQFISYRKNKTLREHFGVTRNTPLTCSPDGFVDFVGTCDLPEYIRCFKIHDQTPMAWLDGFGIATGVVFLFVYIFTQLDWLFRIGEIEEDKRGCCFPNDDDPECCFSIKRKRQLFGQCGFFVSVLVFVGGYVLLSYRSGPSFPPESAGCATFISMWMWQCAKYVYEYDTGTCRYSILQKLFDTYAEDFSNDPAKAAKATSKYWTPTSTARLLDQVKNSISFPACVETAQLDGYQLKQYMADGYKRRDAQTHAQRNDWGRDYQDAAVRWTLEQQNSNDTNSTTIAMPTNEDDDRVAKIKKEMEAVRAMFDSVDANEDGNVSKEELAAKLETDAKLKGMLEDAGIATDFYVLEQIDTDKDAHISFEEFQEAIIVDGKWTTDSLNRGIFAFVCAIKNMPPKCEAYRNPKMPVGSMSFSEVWEATWSRMLTDANIKNKHGRNWWELGAAKQNLSSSAAPASDGNADFGFAEPDIIVFDGNNSDGSNADGDNVQF